MLLLVVLVFMDIIVMIFDLYPFTNIQTKNIATNVLMATFSVYIALVILAGWLHVKEEQQGSK